MGNPLAKTAILYQNHSRTVVLIDLPMSIAQAQTASACPAMDMLMSSEPLRQPYPSTEPKSEAARAKILQQTSFDEQKVHSTLRKHIKDALQEISQTHKGDWCLPRHISPVKDHQSRPQKRKCTEVPTETPASDESPGKTTMEQDLHLPNGKVFCPIGSIHLKSPYGEIDNHFTDLSIICNCVVCNDYDVPITITLDPMCHYRIPPVSTFILSSVEDSVETFVNAANRYLCKDSSSAGSGRFDFILADPPWTNRSVRRSKKYRTLEHHNNDPWDSIQAELGEHLAPGGLVGIWVTNKAEPRTKVLTAFENWGVQLVEEWIWVKTTIHGEPVTVLDGLWRKPYEILLLGRKSQSHGFETSKLDQFVITRRIICGVPDLHSRKPSLKELIEPLMPTPYCYRALEVFARNLTAGWWSWGDEVLKYNSEGHWVTNGASSTVHGPLHDM
ncbi:MAG: hypothetical protein M1830_001936 [Pleopsidium flavum]|nr:MAG: hypothetical protein M1830_001936 [Pleopsidium flavum]